MTANITGNCNLLIGAEVPPMDNLIAFTGCICFTISLYLDWPDLIGCVSDEEICCIKGNYLCFDAFKTRIGAVYISRNNNSSNMFQLILRLIISRSRSWLQNHQG